MPSPNTVAAPRAHSHSRARTATAAAMTCVAVAAATSVWGSATAGAQPHGTGVETALSSYAEAVSSGDRNAYTAAVCAEEARFSDQFAAAAVGESAGAVWSAAARSSDRHSDFTILSVDEVTIEREHGTAVVTSQVGGFDAVTEQVPLRFEGGRWLVCPPRAADAIPGAGERGGGMAPQSHLTPPITVPAAYVYDPDCTRMPPGESCDRYRPRHDYCTSSPDSFWGGPNRVVDFRGPCARHDMCYSFNFNSPPVYAKSSGKFLCDGTFHDHLRQNCAAELGGVLYAAQRTACYAVALAYFDAVFVGGGWGPDPLGPI